MIELFDRDITTESRQSSKGNQLKWRKEQFWYKADYTGYEGLSEYLVSHLLQKTDLKREQYIMYQTEEIVYKTQTYKGCVSPNFLPEGWQMITLERLFQTFYGRSLNESIYTISDIKERIRFTAEQTEAITELQNFGKYISILLTIDAFFLNEDRHTHNIAVLLDDTGRYQYCPVFDHGGSLLSDTTMDYPLSGNVDEMIYEVEAKTFSGNFEEQLDAAEQLYGRNLHLNFGWKDVERLLTKEPYYSEKIKERTYQILRWQIHKYQYLFLKK